MVLAQRNAATAMVTRRDAVAALRRQSADEVRERVVAPAAKMQDSGAATSQMAERQRRKDKHKHRHDGVRR